MPTATAPASTVKAPTPPVSETVEAVAVPLAVRVALVPEVVAEAVDVPELPEPVALEVELLTADAKSVPLASIFISPQVMMVLLAK